MWNWKASYVKAQIQVKFCSDTCGRDGMMRSRLHNTHQNSENTVLKIFKRHEYSATSHCFISLFLRCCSGLLAPPSLLIPFSLFSTKLIQIVIIFPMIEWQLL